MFLRALTVSRFGKEIRDLSTVTKIFGHSGHIIARFAFRYRSRDFLQAQGIASPLVQETGQSSSHSEEPEISVVHVKDEDPDVLDEDTIRDRKRMKRLQDELQNLERKEAKRASKRVKREPISHQGVFKQGEIIDLT